MTDTLESKLHQWTDINTHTFNTEGIQVFSLVLEEALRQVADSLKHVPVTPSQIVQDHQVRSFQSGDILYARKRQEAPLQVLFVGHMDTVYPLDQKFEIKQLDDGWLSGPGIADMKGGLLVLFSVLELLELLPFSEKIGWGVVLTKDEEMGSPCSSDFLTSIADDFDFGLVFEPALKNGHMICSRMGSSNLFLSVKGVASHVGRADNIKQNSVFALKEWFELVRGQCQNTVIFNVSPIQGGKASNVVPESVTASCNFRAKTLDDMQAFESVMMTARDDILSRYDVAFDIQSITQRDPKTCADKNRKFIQNLVDVGVNLGIDLQFEDSAGVCDGNTLESAGLPTIDTMGPWGRHLHSEKEAVYVPSIQEKIDLCLALLEKLAISEMDK